MEPNTYSEKDIQDYAAGIFSGNTQAFEAFLQKDPRARQQVESYRSLYQLLNREQTPSLSFSLADNVIGKIGRKEQLKEGRLFRLLCLLLILTGTGGMLFVQKHYGLGDFSSIPEPGLLAVSAGMLLLFVGGFSSMEMQQKQKKFA